MLLRASDLVKKAIDLEAVNAKLATLAGSSLCDGAELISRQIGPLKDKDISSRSMAVDLFTPETAKKYEERVKIRTNQIWYYDPEIYPLGTLVGRICGSLAPHRRVTIGTPNFHDNLEKNESNGFIELDLQKVLLTVKLKLSRRDASFLMDTLASIDCPPSARVLENYNTYGIEVSWRVFWISDAATMQNLFDSDEFFPILSD